MLHFCDTVPGIGWSDTVLLVVTVPGMLVFSATGEGLLTVPGIGLALSPKRGFIDIIWCPPSTVCRTLKHSLMGVARGFRQVVFHPTSLYPLIT